MKVFCIPSVAMFGEMFSYGISDERFIENFCKGLRFSVQGYENFAYFHNKKQRNSYFANKSCRSTVLFKDSEIYNMLCGLDALHIENLVAFITLKIDISSKRCLNEQEIKLNICYSKAETFHVFYEYVIQDFFYFIGGKEYTAVLSTITKDSQAWNTFFLKKIQNSLILPVCEGVSRN